MVGYSWGRPLPEEGGASGGWLMRCLFDRGRDKQMDAFERCCGESWLDGWMIYGL